MLMTRVCCTVSLGTGFNKVSFVKFSKKICAILENTMKLGSCLYGFVWSISLVSFFNCYVPLWLFAFVYLISGGVLYVVRLNLSLSFSSFLASLDVCRMQNMEPGTQRPLEHVLLHRHMGRFLLLILRM